MPIAKGYAVVETKSMSENLTAEMVEAAIFAEIKSYYSDSWNRRLGPEPPEIEVRSVIDGVLRRLFGDRKKDCRGEGLEDHNS